MRLAVAAGIRGHDHSLHTGHAQRKGGCVFRHVKAFALVVITVNGEEQAGLHLPHPVDCRAGADIRGAGAPHGAHGGGRKHGNDSFGKVRHVCGDKIPAAYPGLAHGCGKPYRLLIHLVPCKQPPCMMFSPENQAGPAAPETEKILRVVQPCSAKPFCAGEAPEIVYDLIVRL